MITVGMGRREKYAFMMFYSESSKLPVVLRYNVNSVQLQLHGIYDLNYSLKWIL